MDLEYSRFGILVTDSDYWPQISGQGLRILAMYSESWTCRPNPGHVVRIHRIPNRGDVFLIGRIPNFGRQYSESAVFRILGSYSES
jgi:hypothetical protein